MDTISRENTSYLPVVGVIMGVAALVLAAVALAKVSSANKTILAHAEQLTKVDTFEGEVRSAVAASEKANSGVAVLQRSTQDGFNAISQELGNIRGEVSKVQEAAKAPPRPTNGKAAAGPVVAGPDEYVVKSGDSGAKIARTIGATLGDLQAVNPTVNWTKLKPGDKIKLPKK